MITIEYNKPKSAFEELLMPPLIKVKSKLYLCQECKGYGGETEVIYAGQGPFVTCGWCHGTGEVTGTIRAAWLNEKKREKNLFKKLSNRRPVQWVWFE